MKRIFCAILLTVFAIGIARADCAENEFAYTDQSTGDVTCIESKFQITTIDMESDTVFSFSVGMVNGVLYIDWGDGTTEKQMLDNSMRSITHTFIDGGPRIIQFGSVITSYNTQNNINHYTVRFNNNTNIAELNGSLGRLFPSIGNRQPDFNGTFVGCKNLTKISKNLFSGILGQPRQFMFRQTFKGCSKLGNFPDNMGNLSGAPTSYLFYETFYDCGNLTEKIPSGLFGQMDGVIADNAFKGTFQGCKNIYGTIPPGLFGTLSGTPKANMFDGTFNGCAKLVGYIPSNLFGSITNTPVQNNMMRDIFYNTKVYTKCPCGTRQYITGFENYWSDRVSCQVGKKSNEHWNNGVCTTDCELGFTTLKTSNNLEYPILTDATSQHSINVGVGNDVCHVPLANGAANNAINASFGGATYHATVPDEIVPTGFTGQPAPVEPD